jgi:hypothetical protein
MQKVCFSRYFYMCASIILVSIILIGVVLLSFSAQFFKQDRTDLLARNARQAASLTAENYLSNGSRYVDSQTVLRRLLYPRQRYRRGDLFGGCPGNTLHLHRTGGLRA